MFNSFAHMVMRKKAGVTLLLEKVGVPLWFPFTSNHACFECQISKTRHYTIVVEVHLEYGTIFCCEWSHQNSPHLCIFKMFRMKRGIQKYPQQWQKTLTPPPLWTPCPRRGGWCLELNCSASRAMFNI